MQNLINNQDAVSTYIMKYIFIFLFTQRDWISMLLGKGEKTLSDKQAANFRNVSF